MEALMKRFSILLLAACISALAAFAQPDEADSSEEAVSTPENTEIQVTEDGRRYLVHPSEIRSGGPPPDGIPSIDDPEYVSLSEADEWIEDDELVLAIIHEGVKRVYPLQILVWHEIVNDTIAGDPLLITYCPLCGSGIAYERTIDGEPVEFGTTGRLYNSNLVMYDRKTNTWWTQIDGLAVVGERTGEELSPVSVNTVTWGQWKAVHPDSQVLSRDTGYRRDYGRDPYGNYYETTSLMFPVENEDNRIHPKEVIFGIEVNGVAKAYIEDNVIQERRFEDEVGDVRVRVERDDAGIVTFTNLETGEEIIKERDFWFAWYAFHPNTTVYGMEDQ
jgi:hypothetical protein